MKKSLVVFAILFLVNPFAQAQWGQSWTPPVLDPGMLDRIFGPWDGLRSGVTVGNGGHVVLCRNKTQVALLETFDLYEGRLVHGHKYIEPLQAEEALPLALSLARKLDEARDLRFESRSLRGKLSLEKKLQHVAKTMRFIKSGSRLAATPDSQEFISFPKNCQLAQAINFRNERTILVNPDLWRALSPLNQAALYLHEAVYWHLRETGVEKDSRRTRRVVAALLAGAQVEAVTLLPAGSQGQLQFCRSLARSATDGDWPTKFFAYQDSKGQVILQMLQISGHRILTRTLVPTELVASTLVTNFAGLFTERKTAVVQTAFDDDLVFRLLTQQGRLAISGVIQPGTPFRETVSCQLLK